MLALAAFVGVLASSASALGNPGLVTLNSTIGPALTVEHLFYGDFPTGIAVSASGRKFCNFPRPSTFTVGELVDGTEEAAFPDQRWNSPPSLMNDTNPMYGSDYADYLISVQTVECEYGRFLSKTLQLTSLRS
jgi:hypothetical protein